MISNHTEGTLGRLRYCLGGNRPSQTTHLTLSRTRIHGYRLESQYNSSGISRTTPPKPKPQLHSLPPILRILHQDPISSYSKGSRGLSVFPRVTGIFTGITISPSLPLRQCSSRYAIRAGRVLSDEEFRYLRLFVTIFQSAASFLRNSRHRCRVRTISLSVLPTDAYRIVSEDDFNTSPSVYFRCFP